MTELNVMHWALGSVWAVLLVASLAVFALTRLKPALDHTELIQRTRSWWIILGIFSVTLLADHVIALWFLGFVSFLALKEFFSMIPTRRADRRVLFWAYLSIPLQYYWAGTAWFGMFIIFIPVYMFLFIAFRMIITQNTQGFLKSAATIHWGLMTCVFSVSHAGYLLTLPDLQTQGGTGGAGLLLFLVALTQFNDVAQYVWGRTLGNRKVLPAVSPKKTWAGLIGGTMTTTLLSIAIAPWLTPFSTLHAVLAGLLIGIFGFVGDVSISAVKRDLGIKDFGAMIPGHGGIMDRIDSLTFTAPLFFHFTWYLYY